MSSRANRRRKAPITAHPVFPGIVALWFAVLLGVGSLLLPAALFEALVRAAHVDSLVPAAAPPLGGTARALIALGMAGFGGLLGVAIARRIAAATTAPVAVVDSARASGVLDDFVSGDLHDQARVEQEEDDALLFSGFEDEEDEELLQHGRVDDAPVFVMPEDLAADPIGNGDAPAEIDVAEPDAAESDPVPLAPEYDLSPAPVHFAIESEPEDELTEDAGEPEYADFADLDEPVEAQAMPDWQDEKPEFPAQAPPPPAESKAIPDEQPSISDLAARLQDVMKRHRDLRGDTRHTDAAPAVVDLPVAAPEWPEAEPVRFLSDETPVEAAPEPASSELDPSDFGPVEYGSTEFDTDADWDPYPAEVHGLDWPAEPEHPEGYDLVATKGKAGIPRPFFDLDFGDGDEEGKDPFGEHDDLASSFALPIPREDGPRVTFAGLADDLLDDPPIEAGEEDEEDEDTSPYGSLLGMKGPYSSGSREPEDEDQPYDAGDDYAPEYEFTGEQEGVEDDLEEAGGDLEPLAYDTDVHDGIEDAPDAPAPASFTPHIAPRPAGISREEQDKALRDALLNLQRFSGAA